MSTFGEIVEPGSRNAWEDWDEKLQSESKEEMKWEKSVLVPENIKTFLILEGRYLADSIKMQSEFKLNLFNSIPEANLKLYNTDTSDTYVCIIKDYDLLQSSEIIEMLKQYIVKSRDVIAVVTKPLVEYQVQELSSQAYVFRTLSTSNPISCLQISYPKLEQPNILSGVSAGAISLREFLNLPGLAVICYMELPEEYQIQELQKLLGQLNFVPAEPKSNSLLDSNLYI